MFLSFQTHLKRHIIDITKQVKKNTLENFNTCAECSHTPEEKHSRV